MSMLVNPYVYSGIDSDVKNFLETTGITDTTTKNAIKKLVADLKSANIWDKLKAIYPIVGGTATTHKYNLKNPLDTDAAFRLQFNGGWTHSSTGALPNGSTGYANTYFNPATNVTTTSFSMGYYSRTNFNASGFSGAAMGVRDVSLDYGSQIFPRYNNYFYSQTNSPGATEYVACSDSRGLFVGSRTGSTTLFSQRNNSQTSFLQNTGAPSYNLFIGARNSAGSPQTYGSYECAFAFMGDWLSTSEGSSLYTIVNTFETALGRNV